MPSMESLFPDGANVDKALLRTWLVSHVDTMAGLRALPAPPASGRIVRLDGYYAPGDGGGGSFTWDSASVQPDNFGTIIAPSSVGAGPGRWIRDFDGEFNVRWFGARGDVRLVENPANPTGPFIPQGSDDTAAFNLATAAAAQHAANTNPRLDPNLEPVIPRRVRVPSGTYRVDGPVYIRNGQHLAGDGTGATRILPLSQTLIAGRWIVFVLGKGTSNGGNVNSSVGMAPDAGGLPATLSDLIVYNTVNPVAGPPPTAVFSEAEGYSVHNVWATACDIGFDLGGGHGVISNLQADVGRVGLRIAGHNHNLTNISCFNNYVGIEFPPVDNPFHHGTSEVKVTNLNVYGPKQTGVYIWPHATFRYQNITIADAHFYNGHPELTFPAPQGTDGFVFSTADGAQNIVFDNCTFANSRNHALRFVHASASSAHYIVKNCVFEGTRSLIADDHADAATPAALLAQNCRVELLNCSIKNLGPAAYNWVNDRYYTPPSPPAPPTYSGCVSLKGKMTFLMKGVQVLNYVRPPASSSPFVDLASLDGSGSEIVFSDVDLSGTVPLFGHRPVDSLSVRGCRRWLGEPVLNNGRLVWKLPYQRANQWIVTVRLNMNSGGDGNYRKASSYVVSKQSGLTTSKVDLLTSTPLLLAGATSNLPQLVVQFGLNAMSATSGPMSQSGDVWISVPSPFAAGLPQVASYDCEVDLLV